MNTILVIMRLTFREAVRRKIALAAFLLGIAFLIVYNLGFYFIHQDLMNSVGRMGTRAGAIQGEIFNFLVLAGMYVVNFLGVASAALITADSLAGEIQSGTIQAIVTKPVHRGGVVLGKWLGYASLLILYLLLMGGGVMASVWIQAGYQTPNWLTGLSVIYFNSLVIMTLALAFSSRFSTLATGGAVFGAYGVAFIGGWVERIGTFLKNDTAVNLGIFSSLLLPSEALWNKAAYVMTAPLSNLMGATPFTSASQPSTMMIVYAGVYLLVVLGIAVWQFYQRDL
jgi:Cu-processing system permease protein